MIVHLDILNKTGDQKLLTDLPTKMHTHRQRFQKSFMNYTDEKETFLYVSMPLKKKKKWTFPPYSIKTFYLSKDKIKSETDTKMPLF